MNFKAYLAGALLLSLQDDRAVVGLANAQARDWLENRLAKRIASLLAQLSGRRGLTLEWVILEAPNGFHADASDGEESQEETG